MSWRHSRSPQWDGVVANLTLDKVMLQDLLSKKF